jgi:hypothetical protein
VVGSDEGDGSSISTRLPTIEDHVTNRLLALLALTLTTTTQAQTASVQQVSWLAGCWEMKAGNRVALEMWMPPEAGLMLGASRTVAAGAVREFEQVRLAEKDGKLVYTALPSRQAEASFTSIAVTDSSFTVENLQHDFPQRIIYTKRGADSLVARIEGPGPNGTRGLDYPMRRIPCERK